MANEFSQSGIGQPVAATTKARVNQIENSTGGFVFQVDDKTRLERFLILGTKGGTYYSREKNVTLDNVDFLLDLINRDEQLVIDCVVEISTSGRAYRNAPAIFAVACLAKYGKIRDLSMLVAKVCRTGEHLFQFASYLELINGGGGWGRSKRTSVANWYTSKSVDNVAYQVVKYRQRHGWTHADLLRLSHPVGLDAEIGAFVLNSELGSGFPNPLLKGFKLIQSSTSVEDVLRVLDEYKELPWETIPTQFLPDARVWKKLFANGQLKGQALVRNVTKLAELGAFDDMVFAREYATALTDETMIQRTRLHPFQYLLALSVYTQGRVERDKNGLPKSYYRTKNWTESPIIVAALNDGFHKAFRYVEPANKRTMLCLDVSGSMTNSMAGVDISAAEMVAAMAMVVARTEPYYHIIGFADKIRDLGINPNMDLQTIMQKTRDQNFGYTNIANAFEYAQSRRIEVDTFVVMTDNEVNDGPHPFQALQRYRRAMNLNTRLVVVACTPTEFTIADPNDAGMLDISGGDANLPSLIANFSAGRI